jgi:hypothetical protein
MGTTAMLIANQAPITLALSPNTQCPYPQVSALAFLQRNGLHKTCNFLPAKHLSKTSPVSIPMFLSYPLRLSQATFICCLTPFPGAQF